MKKSLKLAAATATMMALASCSGAIENAPESAHGDITVSVNTAVETRAQIATVEGYELKCIMQLIDTDGEKVGEQKTMGAASGSTAFVITGAELDAGATGAIFWAEYQPTASGTAKIYNTDDLTNISFNKTEFNLAQSADIDACDAFAGRLDKLANNASVTLVRPFACVSFTPENPENAAGCNSLAVEYDAPSGYNILTGKTAAQQNVKLSNAQFDPQAEPWFRTFIFGSQDKQYLESEMSIKIDGAKSFDLTIAAGKIPVDANYQVNLTGKLGNAATQDIDINVNINGGWNNDPDQAAEMKVGSYVKANGEVTLKAAEAVGIVFALGAIDGDNISAYPAQYAGKIIKGYAVAVSNVASARQSFGAELIAGLQKNSDLNGLEITSGLIDKIAGCSFATTYNDWVNAHTLSGNTTAWYIPSLNQLVYWLHMLYPDNKGEAATGSAEFQALFPQNTIFDRDPIVTVNYASSTINDAGNISGVRMNAGATPNCQAAGINVSTQTNQSALCRPMFTIFE